MRTKNNKTNKLSPGSKVLIWSLAGIGTLAAGYAIYKIATKNKKAGNDTDLNTLLKQRGWQPTESPAPVATSTAPKAALPAPVSKPAAVPSPTAASNEFPLKKGSKGEKVQLLQVAINKKSKKDILKVDGIFGSKTEDALKKLNQPIEIDQTRFLVLVGDIKPISDTVAAELFAACKENNLQKALDALFKIKSTEEYQVINQKFKARLLNGVETTIVTGLLEKFSKEEQKDQLREAFMKIGLVYNGDKWSLSGLEGPTIMTIQPAVIYTPVKKEITVPAKTVLGREVTRRSGYSCFENKGKHFLVKESFVEYVNA